MWRGLDKMKERFEELFKILKLDRKVSPWSQRDTFEKRHSELVKEIEEIKLAIQNKDTENLKEEIGDSLWDLMCVMVVAEEKELFTAKEVIEGAIEKIKRRKPWIFTGEKITIEDEARLWQIAKAKEKQNKQ